MELYALTAIFYSLSAYAYIIGTKSLSDLWYKAKCKYLFCVATFAYAILAIIIGLQYNETWALIAGAPLMYVIGSPNYKRGGIWEKVHYGGAIASVLGAFGFLIAMGYWGLIIPIISLFTLGWIFDRSRTVLWLEILVMSGVIFMYFDLRL